MTTEKEAKMKAMDDASMVARKEWDELYPKLDEDTVKAISKWLEKHFVPAGWKRLGRILCDKD